MKCRECSSCQKGYWASNPEAYVCIGVKEPFEIMDVNAECTEYDKKKNKKPKTDASNRFFVEAIKPEDTCLDILTWYRDLYYAEPTTTERGIMANAINDLISGLNLLGEQYFKEE